MQPYNTPADRDPELWRIARRRAKFKSHLLTYLLVNALLWGIWFFTDGGRFTGGRHGFDVPWPAWATLFWGIGLVFQGLGTYGALSRTNLTQREYDRLTRER